MVIVCICFIVWTSRIRGVGGVWKIIEGGDSRFSCKNGGGGGVGLGEGNPYRGVSIEGVFHW